MKMLIYIKEISSKVLFLSMMLVYERFVTKVCLISKRILKRVMFLFRFL